MVEILTVMGIIVVLVGLLFTALKFARNSAASSRTKAQLETLRGMISELDAANNLSQSPPNWLWYDDSSTGGIAYHNYPVRSIPSALAYFPMQNGSILLPGDFWQFPFGLPYPSGGGWSTAAQCWDSLDSPGDVGTDSPGQQIAQRNASFAILNTQLAMQMLAGIGVNRTALQNLPANSTMLPSWQGSGAVPLAAPNLNNAAVGTGLLGLLREDGTDPPVSASGAYYVRGVHVSYTVSGTQYYFICAVASGSNAAVNSTTPPVVGSTAPPWIDESANPRGVPILLDGWGNPIIFVPSSGLRVKLLNGLPGYQTANAQQDYIIISPEGHVNGNGSANAYVDRPGRPFFASAGPDGDFTKGDDNVYSFQN